MVCDYIPLIPRGLAPNILLTDTLGSSQINTAGSQLPRVPPWRADQRTATPNSAPREASQSRRGQPEFQKFPVRTACARALFRRIGDHEMASRPEIKVKKSEPDE